MFTFTAYVILEGDLNASLVSVFGALWAVIIQPLFSQVFTALALFNIQSRTMFMIPRAASTLAEGLVGMQRINKFLQRAECVPQPQVPE